jgi:hypothetical protein
MPKLSVVQEMRELKTHLSYSKNTGFFFGAGTSCALGIPNIAQLTREVESGLAAEDSKMFAIVRDDLKPLITLREVNIEDILNQVRRIRELTRDSDSKSYMGVCGKDAASLDRSMCKEIYRVLSGKETSASLDPMKKFLAWYNMSNPDFMKEVYTTNYDLVIEMALESNGIPYFDGFVGAHEPFFWQESVEKAVSPNDLTRTWIRLWKIHGSLSWFWKTAKDTGANRIVRIGNAGPADSLSNELVIYPSKEKYDSSRKQPFITYFDRLRNFLLSGELLFGIAGYSFSDQHINEIIFNCLRQNNRLFTVAWMYNDEEVDAIHRQCSAYLNLDILGPTRAIVRGELVEWQFDSSAVMPNEDVAAYWDVPGDRLKIGDFRLLVDFLIASSGRKHETDKAAP